MKNTHIVSFCCICFFRDYYEVGRKSGIADRFEVKTFFFRDHHDFGSKIAKKRDQIEVKTFFLEIPMILGDPYEYEIKALFFREHQVLEILASGP